MKTQWERELVERPFCRQLERMGWTWIDGDPDLPETTERKTSREVLLKGRLEGALRKLNLRNGQPWLDDARIARAIGDLEQAAGHQLMEINQSATELLLKGTVADGLSDWDQGRPQPVKFIDFENCADNDFLVVSQFKVELASGRGHVIPDAVLFVNGIPLVVAEFKSPGIKSPMQEAINQLLRYSNQRTRQGEPRGSNAAMSEALEVGGLRLVVRRSERRRTIGLTVDRTGDVILSAPSAADSTQLSKWVSRKLIWIHRKLASRAPLAAHRSQPEFVAGESFAYLGRWYPLALVAEQSEPLSWDGVRFHLRRAARPAAREHFRRWYVRNGTTWAENRVTALVRRVGANTTDLKLRELGFR